MKIAIVTTTINIPHLLHEYAANAKQFNHEGVFFIVAGDHKTPVAAATFCQQVEEKFGYPCSYMSPSTQEEFLADFPELQTHLPYNSLSRRNVAILKAYHAGADVIITIDDDNFVEPSLDFIGYHTRVGQEREVTTISASTGWFNVCELLYEAQGLPFYHRGYPLTKRWLSSQITTERRRQKVVVNAGLWLEAPDIDAVTWLDLPIRSIAMKDTYPDGISLAIGTWSPFNSQNTAMAREVIPGYFLSPHIGRYDDIWASYIVKKIADHLGHTIHFGQPLVRQKRNPHNYLIDFDKERYGMEHTPAFTDLLRSTQLRGQTYGECLIELRTLLENSSQHLIPDKEQRVVFEQFMAGLDAWRATMDRIAK